MAIISLEKVFSNKNKFLKILFLFILAIVIWLYAKTYWLEYYRDYALNSFTRVILFTYIALAIWLIIKNTQELQIWKKVIFTFLPVVITIIFLIVTRNYYFTFMNDVLDLEGGNNGLSHLFSYGYSMFLPFVDAGESLEYSSFLSLFPLPLIMAMVYVYKEEKNLDFFMPMIIVIVFESIFCMTGTPIFAIIGLESTMYFNYVAGVVGLSSIYLYMYMITNIEKNIFNLKTSMKIVLAFLVFYFLIPRLEVFMGKGYMYLLAMIITLLYFMFINFADKRYQKVLLVILVIWTLVSSIPVGISYIM